ncbi:MAG: methyltransferase domain-containing protein [Fibromonadaceae bacterium]|jgi:malonyl-CoA O-methyltransferase|nr:methyltransferase domain-containing protein [Fibromonadaceae bacterium]
MPNFSIKASKYDLASEPQAELAEGLFELSLDYLPDIPPVLLDLGCGTGHLSLDLASLFPRHLDCLDISKEMLEICKQKLQANFSNVKWRLFENDAENFEPDIKYDAIYCSATIQWFNELPVFLEKLKKWLNPNGVLCIGAFGEKTLCELRSAYFEATGRHLETKAKLFSSDKLTAIFKESGFKLQDQVECIYTQGFESSIAALKTLGNMGVTGAGKKSLNRVEAQKLKEVLLKTNNENFAVNFSWELLAMIFRVKPSQ